MDALQLYGLEKNYFRGKSGKFAGVRLVSPLNSLKVDRGELFGIIGPDGAGKTTLFRILTTLILPDAGEAKVDGLDIVSDYKEIRRRVGYMPGRFSLYPDLTVEENLNFYASVFGTTVKDNYALIESIYSQIEPFKKRRAAKLSGGMKQKLALCCAMVHRPLLLFLDEPTTGVDPVSRKEFWQILHNLKTEGMTMIVSTPYMDEATLCDRIALMRDGRFLKIETPHSVVAGFGEALWTASSAEMFRLLKDLRCYPSIKRCYTFGAVHHFTVDERSFSAEELNLYLIKLSHKDIVITTAEATVEDCYMQLAEE